MIEHVAGIRAAGVLLIVSGLCGCLALPQGSPDAQELHAQARYPRGAYPITSAFGDTRDSAGRRRRGAHAGVDIRAPEGTAVIAALSGPVRVVRHDTGGTVVFQDATLGARRLLLEYSHLAGLQVRDGDVALRGQVLGTVGATGRGARGVAHLHFAVLDRERGLVDPAVLLVGTAGIACADDSNVSSAPQKAPVLLYPVACSAR